MKEPFDIEIAKIEYAVFPEEDEIYTIFKEGIEYLKIQKDTEGHWLRLDPDTDITLFEESAEVNLIGREIENFSGDAEDSDTEPLE
jgi:hypothetical protein